jgi:hypothetical protein
MKRIKGLNGRVYHLLEDRASFPLCSKYVSRDHRNVLTASQVETTKLCKDCEKRLNVMIDGLLAFTSDATPEPKTTKKPSTNFDNFLAELEDLTQEYGEEETIFGMQILTLKKRYRKA